MFLSVIMKGNFHYKNIDLEIRVRLGTQCPMLFVSRDYITVLLMRSQKPKPRFTAGIV